jgi:hypothetical protein
MRVNPYDSACKFSLQDTVSTLVTMVMDVEGGIDFAGTFDRWENI